MTATNSIFDAAPEVKELPPMPDVPFKHTQEDKRMNEIRQEITEAFEEVFADWMEGLQ